MHKYKKGSITIVASLSITMISALLMALLELGRVTEMQKIAKISADSAAESLFANYEKTLWDEYHLLGVTNTASRNGYVKNLIEDSLYSSGENRGSLFQSTVQSAEISKINYLTDQKGRVFEAAVSSYMGNNVGFELYDYIKDLSEEITGLENSDVDVEGKINSAGKLLGIDGKIAPKPKAMNSSKESVIRQTNPVAEVSKVRASGILSLVLRSGTKISGKKIDTSNSLLRRTIQQGDGEDIEKSWYQGLVTLAYMKKYLSSFQEPVGERALEYEQEYVIAGKQSDEANLKSVVLRILAIREVSNFLFAMKDKTMVAEATSVATAISIATWQPWMKDVVKYGILAAWAFAESILDLRALLDGDKVALFKNTTQWTSRLSKLPKLLSGYAKAKNCENGIDYETYLLVFTFLESTRKRAYRAMDVMEATVRAVENRDDFCMNNVMLEAELEVAYRYKPVFAPIRNSLYAEAYSKYSYRKAGT